MKFILHIYIFSIAIDVEITSKPVGQTTVPVVNGDMYEPIASLYFADSDFVL